MPFQIATSLWRSPRTLPAVVSTIRSCMEHRVFELGERLAAVHREALQVWHGVATAGEAEAHLARVARAGDVERLAVNRDRHRIPGLEPRAAEVQRTVRARDIGDHDVERRPEVAGDARDDLEHR